MPRSIQTKTVRPPEVAGTFYPGNAGACADVVARCIAEARPTGLFKAKAVVAPHAGYVFSGPIAGTAFASLANRRAEIRRVVLIGPAHRVAYRGLATTSADEWATPLGSVPVDWASMRKLLSLPDMRVSDSVFVREHSLEVHLPFLQQALDDFTIVPILVGEASHAEVERALKLVWGGPETLISISSDLSHFLDYEAARRLDARTSGQMEILQAERIGAENACGHLALLGALRRARDLDLRVTALDVRNSGDTQGGRDRVVGYGAFVMEYASMARFACDQRARLLKAAHAALEFGVRNQRAPDARLGSGALPPLRAMRASFVTLRIDGRLRGCMGTVAASRPLLLDVMHNAYRAAFKDPRFPPLATEELARVAVEISVLSTPRRIRFVGEADLARKLRPDVDGLILRDGESQGVFLPSVWERIGEPTLFVKHLKGKAGLSADHWSEKLDAFRFSVESIS